MAVVILVVLWATISLPFALLVAATMRRSKRPPSVADEAEAYLRDTRRRSSILQRSAALAGAVTVVGAIVVAGTTAVRHLPSARVIVESRDGGGLHIGLGTTTTTAAQPTKRTSDAVERAPARNESEARTSSTVATFTDVMPDDPAGEPTPGSDSTSAKKDARNPARERTTTSVAPTRDRDDDSSRERRRSSDDDDDDEVRPSPTTSSTSTTSTTAPSSTGTTSTTAAPPSGSDGRDH